MDLKKLDLSEQDPSVLLEILLAIQILCGVAFLICSIVVSHTENAGFNIILMGLINLAFAVAAYYAVGKLKTPILVGSIIGAGIMISLQSLMTAIYWGQLSSCEETEINIRHYTCNQINAYVATSFFAVVMFLLQFTFTGILLYSRDMVLKEYKEYEEVSVYPDESGLEAEYGASNQPRYIESTSADL